MVGPPFFVEQERVLHIGGDGRYRVKQFSEQVVLDLVHILRSVLNLFFLIVVIDEAFTVPTRIDSRLGRGRHGWRS